jgi:methionyl-tRNA formyltransferase
MKIIFLGTPDFAVASLQALVENNYQVVAVVTAPDKPAGRGMKMQSSAVKDYAVLHAIPVLQPEKLKNETFLVALKSFDADLQIVVAFRMLPELVWNMPRFGTINVHASLLPNYRGAAPIHWAIINGEKETGVTTFKLKHQIDTGDVLMQAKVVIHDTDNVGTLYNQLMIEGANLLLQTLQKIENNTLEIQPQFVLPTHQHAPKIFTETCFIDWSKTCHEIDCLIRGLSPSPAAFTHLDEKKFKIFACKKSIENHNLKVGQMQSDHKSFMKFACLDGYIHVESLQMEGKKRMLIDEFLRGYKTQS